jgi:VCBS repeat-containing protein
MNKPQAKNLSRNVIRKAKPAQSTSPVSRVGAAVRSTLMALEPRMLFDGAALATADVTFKEADTQPKADQSAWSEGIRDAAVAFNAPAASAVVNLLVVDQGVQDWQSLVANVAPGTQVLVLDANQDGVSQIARAVSGLTGLQSIQVLSHGDSGQVSLGNKVVDTAALQGYSAELSAIGQSLASNGDILLFGCDVGSGAAGASFLQTLARATNADIAASTDSVGSAKLGGDWTVEAQTGTIESQVVLAEASTANYAHLLDSINVNNPGNVAGTFIEGHLFDATSSPSKYPNGPVVLDPLDRLENCLTNVEVCLIWAGADGVFQTTDFAGAALGDDMIYRVLTGDGDPDAVPAVAAEDTYGVYKFSNLALGNYKVCVPTVLNGPVEGPRASDPASGDVVLCNDAGSGTQNDGIIDVDLSSVPNGQSFGNHFRYAQVNTGPEITTPANQTATQGVQLVFDNTRLITFADEVADPTQRWVDAGVNYEVIISADHGNLGISPIAGVTQSGGLGSPLVLTGSLINLNTAIQGLLYTANTNFVGQDTLRITLNDHGNGGDSNGNCIPVEYAADNLSATKQILINVAADPTIPPVGNDDVNALCWSQVNVSGNVRTNDTDNMPNSNLAVCGVAMGSAAGVPSAGVGSSVLGNYGSIIINADGTYTYTVDIYKPAIAPLDKPDAVALTETFTYCVRDADGNQSKATLTITIKPNQVPVLLVDAATIAVGSTSTAAGNVLANDSDPDGDRTKLFVYAVGNGSEALGPASNTGVNQSIAGVNGFGNIVIQADGSYVFTINAAAAAAIPAGQTRTETFEYAVRDECDGCSKQNIVITINSPAPVNLPPAAAPDAFQFCVGQTPPTGSVLTNDSDPNGDSLTVCGVVAGNQATVPNTGVGSAINSANGFGSLRINADGTYTYVLNAANATVAALTPTSAPLLDVYTYCVTDGQGSQVRTTVTISICPPANQAPVPTPDSNTVCAGVTTPATGNVLANDTDPNAGDVLRVCGVVSGDQATVPTSGVGIPVVSANGYGSLTVNADGTYSYTLDQTNPTVAALRPSSAPLTDVFTYCVTDASGNQQRTTISISICPPGNLPPVARPDEVCIDADRTLAVVGNVVSGIGLNSSDSDPNRDPLMVQGASAGNGGGVLTAGVGGTLTGQYGTITINMDGSFSYTLKPDTPALLAAKPGDPRLNDVFTYTIKDGNGATSTSTLTICIEGVNDCPVPVNDANQVSAASGSNTGGNVLGGPGASAGDKADTDPDGDKLQVCGVAPGALASAPNVGVGSAIAGMYGSLVLNADGRYTYTVDSSKPAVAALKPGQTLTETFTYCVTDGTCAPQAGQLVVTVTGFNRPPVAMGRPDMTLENGDIKCDLIGVSDPDNTNPELRITIDSITNAASGTFFLREPIAGQPGQFRETIVAAGSQITGEQAQYLCFRPNPAANAARGPDGALLPPTLTFTVRDPNGASATASTTITVKPPVPVVPPIVPPIVEQPIVPPIAVLPPVIPALNPPPIRELPATSFVPLDLAPALDPVSLFEPQPFNGFEKALDVPAVKSTAVEAKPAAVKADDDCIPVKPKVKPKAVKRAIYTDVKPVVKFSEQLKVAKQRFKLPPKVAPRPAVGKDC